ncbi:MAG TPA: hypothetical protein VD761_03585 [Solirubrobacterales bacterium]|nr:hypothetical protein [Solirubrobacterales bacterium]
MYRSGILSGVVVLALLAGGCGDGTSSGLTNAEFVEQANAVCSERKKEWKSAVASYGRTVEAEGAEDEPAAQREIAKKMLSDSMLPALNSQQQRLEELEVPEGSERQILGMLQALSEGIRDIEGDGLKALYRDGFAAFEQRAAALGISCPL